MINLALLAALEVIVSGLQSDKGKVIISVWRDSPGFSRLDTAKASVSQTVSIQHGEARASFGNLSGQVAVSAFHDENADGKLATNFIGIPREGVGLSNNPGGMPNFKASLMSLPATATIKLRYFGK